MYYNYIPPLLCSSSHSSPSPFQPVLLPLMCVWSWEWEGEGWGGCIGLQQVAAAAVCLLLQRLCCTQRTWTLKLRAPLLPSHRIIHSSLFLPASELCLPGMWLCLRLLSLCFRWIPMQSLTEKFLPLPPFWTLCDTVLSECHQSTCRYIVVYPSDYLNLKNQRQE